MSKLLESIVDKITAHVGSSDISTCAVLHHDDSITIVVDPRTISRVKLTEKGMYEKLSTTERGSLYYSATTTINENQYQVLRVHRNALNIPMVNPSSIDIAITDIITLSKLTDMMEAIDDDGNDSRHELISILSKMSKM